MTDPLTTETEVSLYVEKWKVGGNELLRETGEMLHFLICCLDDEYPPANELLGRIEAEIGHRVEITWPHLR